jgi:hypothetical protein
MLQTSRRHFLKTSLALAGGSVFARLGLNAQTPAPPTLAEQLALTDVSGKRIGNWTRLKLASLAPVVAAPDGGINHIGWPVAAQLSDGTAVVIYQRARGGHINAGVYADAVAPAGRYAITSRDLREWLPENPFGERARLGPPDGMHCVGVARKADGGERVVVVASGAPRMVYYSDDKGVAWSAALDALANVLEGAVHCGPCLISHRDFGLVAAFGQEKSKTGRRNWLIRSKDAGMTWEQRIWNNSAPARGVEPALATWGPGHMVMIAREYVPEYAINAGGYYCYTQHVYKHTAGGAFDKVSFSTARTNITGNAAAGFDCHDTADVIYNPVSKRIECIQSHRWGGGGPLTGKTIAKSESGDRQMASGDRQMNTLNLWSIAPDDLLGGGAEWRFECTLVGRRGYSGNSRRDGMHPGGSIVDVARGMQHVFFYAGWRRRPASVFRFSRTLDTEKLREAGYDSGSV